MRLRSLVLAFAATLALAAPAAAQSKLMLGLNGGIGLPVGDFGDVASTGFNLGVTGDYALSSAFAVGGEIGWHTFGGNDDFEKDLSALAGEAVDVTVRAIPFGVHGKATFPAGVNATPFARAGVGLYNLNVKLESASGEADDSETKFGVNLGAGANLRLNDSMSWGGDFLFHNIFTEDESTTLLTLRVHLLFGVAGTQ